MAEKIKKERVYGSSFEKSVPKSFKHDELVKQFASLLVESSEDAIIAETLEGEIVSWNPAAERMFGYTAAEIIGQPMKTIGTDKNKNEFDNLIEKVKKGVKIERYETIRKSKSGRNIQVSVTISPVKDKSGKIIGLSAIDRDITQKKESAGYARSLIEASVDPLVTISQDGKITDVNEATIKATGAAREELVGSIFSDYFTEPKKAEEGYKQVLKENVVRDYPLTIKHKNGKLMDVLYNASTYKDANGKVIGVFAAARDITEQKQASQYARSLIEASLDPLVTISPDGKITDVNEATIKATGATREELVGSIFSDYFTKPEKAEEGYQTVLQKGSVSDYALTIKSKDGKLMDVLYNASVYKDDKGKVIGVFAAARDVTKSRQASQYARSLIEASVDPLVTISPDGKITDVNEATIQATGAPRKELIGSVFSNYFTEPTKAESGYKQVLKENIVRDYPLTIKNRDGKLMDVLYNASVYKDVRGKVIGVFAAARDITEQKQASQYARSLIEASLDPLVTISADGKITDVNQATINVTGVPKDQLIGSDFSLYFTEPDKARSGYQEAFKEGIVRDYLLTIRSRVGKETPVLYNASIYKDDKGKVLGVFAAAREISRSELKAARARELQRVSKQIVFKVIVSYKMSKGNVKLSEIDARKMSIDLVDNVTVNPTRAEIANKRFTALSMTNSRLPEGTLVMSVPDSKLLGLEENDTVFLSKAGADAEIDLVDSESYASKPGEYESAGLNAAAETEEPIDTQLPEEEARDAAEKQDKLMDKGEEMAKEVTDGDNVPEAADEPAEKSNPLEKAEPVEEADEKVEEAEPVEEADEKAEKAEPVEEKAEKAEQVEEADEKAEKAEQVEEADEKAEEAEPVEEKAEKAEPVEEADEKAEKAEQVEEADEKVEEAEPVEAEKAESVEKADENLKQAAAGKKVEEKKASKSKPVESSKSNPEKKKSEKEFEDQIDALRGS
jgi:PAS domain S-box-containing protein